MAFGNPVTDGVQVQIGSQGYVARFNLSTLNPYSVKQVQLQNSGTSVASAVYPTAVSLDTVFGYVEDSACPDVAWCYQDQEVFVFLKTTAWDFVSTSRIGFWVISNPEEVTATTDVVIPDRIPSEARNLLVLLCAKEAQTLSGINPSRDILQQIQQELNRLGLA